METIVLLLFILVCFSFLLKQTFVRNLQIAITAVAAMVFTGLAWRVAILQSSTEIAAWLANTDLVRDISVLLNIDVLLAMAFCLLAADVKVAGRIGRKARWLLCLFAFLPRHYDRANDVWHTCRNYLCVSWRGLFAHRLVARCSLFHSHSVAHIPC